MIILSAGILTVGIGFLALGAVLALIGIFRGELRNRSAPAAIGGFAVIPLYLAWLNRGGPGQVCSTTATSVSCTQEWAPWPFVAVALGLVAVCAVTIRRTAP